MDSLYIEIEYPWTVKLHVSENLLEFSLYSDPLQVTTFKTNFTNLKILYNVANNSIVF
jgi:hypothetical protein